MQATTRTAAGLKSLSAALCAAAIVLAGALAPLDEAAAQTGIRDTRHNLGTSTRSPAITGANTFSGSDEICVFCHTPHGASTGAGNPPLWNRSIAAPAGGYTIYNSSTMDASRATDGVAGSLSIGSVSIACLSCHDGTQAMNAVINAPGSGLAGNAAWTAGTWTGAAAGATPVGSIGSVVGNLTTDLSNDHPIGIAYCGWSGITGSGTAATLSCSDGDFKAPKAATISGQQVFWVDDGTNNTTRNKTDLTLYNRTFAAGTGPSVECATCHDPHSTNTTFLRIANAGSAVCLACHVK